MDPTFFSEAKLENFAFLPVENPELDKLYQEQKGVMWTAQEIDYSNDRAQWDTLDPNTQSYIKFILFLFAQLDGIVNENLVENFKKETSCMSKDCSKFYAYQEAIEWTHNETYSNLIKAFIRDSEEQKRGLNSIKNYPAIRKIAEWAYQWMGKDKPLTERLVAFACIEGIIFSSAFAGIYWIKRQNVLHGLTKANEWIARDEGIHTRFAISLYLHITTKWKKLDPLSPSRVEEIIRSAVRTTEEFTRTAMNVQLVGLNADDMCKYVRCTADVLTESLGYKKFFGDQNPFQWMMLLVIPNKTNFFEARVTEYSKEVGETGFDFDEDIKF